MGLRSAIPRSSSSFATPICRRRPTSTSAPTSLVTYRIKFKAEALPLKGEIGGVRTLYSHNAQFPMSHVHAADREALSTLMRLLPPLHAIKAKEDEKVELVNHTAIEEVLLDVGTLDFGKGIEAKANVAVWRTRGESSSWWVSSPISASSSGRTSGTPWR